MEEQEEQQESEGCLHRIGRLLLGAAIILFFLGLCNGYLHDDHKGDTLLGWIAGCIGCGIDLLVAFF